jgi:hypothetical protein
MKPRPIYSRDVVKSGGGWGARRPSSPGLSQKTKHVASVGGVAVAKGEKSVTNRERVGVDK